MTKGSISKKTHFGVILGLKLGDMAMAEEDPIYRACFFFGIFALILAFWIFQTTLDYLGDIRKTNNT